jgi:hypothetical protein
MRDSIHRNKPKAERDQTYRNQLHLPAIENIMNMTPTKVVTVWIDCVMVPVRHIVI